MKKLLALLLCAMMLMTSVVACTGDIKLSPEDEQKLEEAANAVAEALEEAAKEEATAEPTEEPTAEPAAEEPAPAEPTVEGEPIPEPFQHITFDGETDEGYTTVKQNLDENGVITGIVAAEDAFVEYVDGKVGKAARTDGKFGLNLNLKPTNTDAYTIAFWVKADRLATFGPTLQIGYDIGASDAEATNNVTWMNVTQSEWGMDNAKIFPVVWSRNQASGSWPWMYAFDDAIHGKKEWVHVAIVVSGEEADFFGTKGVHAKFYLDGVEVYDTHTCIDLDFGWPATVAPDIMKPGDKTFESYWGVNYWDTVFKGNVDDMYTFDSALTAGQVATLFAMGDPNVQ